MVSIPQPLTLFIEQEGDVWLSRYLELPVASFGDTFEEAEEMVYEALSLYFEVVGEEELKRVYRPSSAVTKQVEVTRLAA